MGAVGKGVGARVGVGVGLTVDVGAGSLVVVGDGPEQAVPTTMAIMDARSRPRATYFVESITLSNGIFLACSVHMD